jgi:ribosomal protein L3 glutamine methyltransferase
MYCFSDKYGHVAINLKTAHTEIPMYALNIEIEDLHTLRDFLRRGVSLFNEADLWFGHGTDNAVDEVIHLILHSLHLPYNMPEAFWECRVTSSEKSVLAAMFRQRIEKRRPAAYITGKAWFAGLPFYVDERVLVPRSPIAELIERDFSPWLQPENILRILDIGTGSGCIAIACALAFSAAEVDAVDVSPDALEVLHRNISEYGLEDRVHAVYSDVFSALGEVRYDLIVANPPYVDAAELAAMPPEYHHEPSLGLAAGADGLDIVRRILAQAPQHINPGGLLVVEVGASEDALIAAYPEIDFVWLEFNRGGSGVFVLNAEQLAQYAELFQQRSAA